VGISRRAAGLRGSCGARRSPDFPGRPDPGHPGTATSACSWSFSG